MDLIPDSGVYILVLMFGAIAVAVHASNIYGTTLPCSTDSRRSALLAAVEVRYLSGVRSRNVGLLCYLAINEFAYLVLSTSSVILDLSLSVVSGEGTVGAATGGAGLNPLTPVLASSVMMTISQFKPFSEIENAIRRLSHHVGGIPHGVDEMLNRIKTFQFASEGTQGQSHAVENACIRAKQVNEYALCRQLNTHEARIFSENVLRIYALQAWTFGYEGERIWSSQSLAALENTISLVKPKFEFFNTKLLLQIDDQAEAEKMVEGSYQSMLELTAIANGLKNDLAAILALLMINQPEVQAPENSAQISSLLQHLKRVDKEKEGNALVGSTFFGLAIGFVAVWAFYMVTMTLSDWVASFGSASSSVAAFPPDETADYLFRIFNKSVYYSMVDVFAFSLVFFTAGSVALTMRSTQLANMQWSYWGEDNYPFRQYMSVGLLATAVALIFYVIYAFVTTVVIPSISLLDSNLSGSLLTDFHSQAADFLPVPAIGLFCSWAVCYLSDSISGYAAGITGSLETGSVSKRSSLLRPVFVFASLGGGFNGVVRVVNGSVFGLRDLAEAIIVPGVTLFILIGLFGLLLARTRTGKTNSTAGEIQSDRRAVAEEIEAKISIDTDIGSKAAIV
ncbi:MAG: hypothetical protein V3U76_01665 [Granulosicoccus sp.]